jgi:hypothetical protein
VVSAAARMLGHLAELLGDWLAVLVGSGDRTRITQLQDDIRGGMARLEIVAGEARQERQTYLTHDFDPDTLVRTVFRLRNDVVMIGRAAAEPLPDRSGRVCVSRSNKSHRPHRASYARAPTRCATASIRPCLMPLSERSQTSSRPSSVREPRERYPQRTSVACMPWNLPLSSYARIPKISVTAS